MKNAKPTEDTCTNVFLDENLEERRKRYTRIWIDIINRAESDHIGTPIRK